MKKVRLILVLTGILVAGIAFNSVAQVDFKTKERTENKARTNVPKSAKQAKKNASQEYKAQTKVSKSEHKAHRYESRFSAWREARSKRDEKVKMRTPTRKFPKYTMGAYKRFKPALKSSS